MSDNRNKTVQVRLNQSEHQEVQNRAKQSGLSTSDYIRAILSQGEVQVVDHGRELIREICSLHASLGCEDWVSREVVEKGMQKLCHILKL